MKDITKKLTYVSCLALTTFASSSLYASGYRLEEQSASVFADSGDAAVVEDASTNWYNSAGLVYIPRQLVMVGTQVYAPTKFTGTTFAPSLAEFDPVPYTGNGTAYSSPKAFLPAMHYAMPLNQKYAFGLTVTPAWGLSEDYGDYSIVRYELTKIYTRSVDVAPSLAMKANDHWSFGIGPDFNYMSIENQFMGRLEDDVPGDSISRYSVQDWGQGWHAGTLFRMNDTTRFGLNYRSKIVMHFQGYSAYNVDVAEGAFETDKFKINFPLPPSTTFSAYHDMNDRWAMMGSVVYDQWNVLKAYYAQNFMTPTGAVTNVTLQQNMRNTFDFGVGTKYKLNDQWLLRGSLRYEPTPTITAFRDVNFPDANKLGINLGAHYQIVKNVGMDLMYAHAFVSNATIDYTNPVTGATLNGHNDTSVNLFSAQLVIDV